MINEIFSLTFPIDWDEIESELSPLYLDGISR